MRRCLEGLREWLPRRWCESGGGKWQGSGSKVPGVGEPTAQAHFGLGSGVQLLAVIQERCGSFDQRKR